MAITNEDIILYQSQDNSDNDSGGGARVAAEVVDGAVNNLFPDISRIDSVSGDVALRKVFPVVVTDNRDIYYGAHSMISAVPEDPLVSALLFFTDSPYDKRIDAQNQIEAYVTASYKSGFYMFGRHIKGARAVTFLQREEEQLPDVGEVYLLEEGALTQYIRITKIESTVITLTYSNIDYKRRRIIATIDQPLEQNFTGSEFHPDGQRDNTCDTYNTQVADAAKFYSTKNVDETAIAGAQSIKVDSIFEQLVPSTKSQSPLVNQDAFVNGTLLITDDTVSEMSKAVSLSSSGTTITTGTPIVPGSVHSSAFGGITDDGSGVLYVDGSPNGTVNYNEGIISYTYNGTGTTTFLWRPANITNAGVQFSSATKVTQENQGLVSVLNVTPVPTMPNAYVDYRSQGKWYRIAANQDGTMGADPSVGVGMFNDNGDDTGTFSITLGALPDVDSSIIYSWGTGDTNTDVREEINTQSSMRLEYPLPDRNIVNSSFTMTLAAEVGTDTVITANADGTLTSNRGAELGGVIDRQNGLVVIDHLDSNDRILPATDGVDDVTLAYDVQDDVTTPGTDGFVSTINNPVFVKKATVLPPANLLSYHQDPADYEMWEYDTGAAINSTNVELDLTIKVGVPSIPAPWWSDTPLTLHHYYGGIMKARGYDVSSETVYGYMQPSGVIRVYIRINNPRRAYTTGYSPDVDTTGTSGYKTNVLTALDLKPVDLAQFESVTAIRLQTAEIPAGNPVTPKTYTQSFGSIAKYRIDLPTSIAGNTALELGSIDAVDQVVTTSGGNAIDDTGLQVGTINNSNGVMTLSYWRSLEKFKVVSLVTYVNVNKPTDFVKYAAFRTAATKLVTSSLQLRYQTVNGSFSATTDANGVVTGTDIDQAGSYVDTQTGMASIVFTAEVNPNSIKYDAVAETSLPLDPELLGLNPVRLPSDGRVPVFTAGRHIVIFNEANTDVATPTAGQVVNLARDKQAYIEVLDVNGHRLDRAQFTADRDTGTVTFANPLVLQDKYNNVLTPPMTIVDRVEDMVLVADAQINGLLSLSAPLTREYGVGSKIASALVWGDIGARYFNLFSQAFFDEWSDTPTQNPTTAKYDDINYPIQLVNKDSAAGRWMIQFKSSTTVDVIHEQLGVVESNVNITTTDVAPINPATSLPYFTMPKEGFGAGWVTSNIVRFNTESGDQNMWVIRTVQSGQLTVEQDNIDIDIRGDAN